jgi:hypothetical protein
VSCGETNIKIWSNKGRADLDADTTAIQDALDQADRIVDGRFRPSVYTVPLADSSGNIPPEAKNWAVVIAAKMLYDARGLRDKDTTGNHLLRLRQAVDAEMGMYAVGLRQMDAVTRTDVDYGAKSLKISR